MKEKILTSLLVLCLFSTQVHAQAVVESMKETNDFIPSKDQRKDYNKQLCALVKVQVVDDITDVEGSVMGDIINHGVEKWVYMAQGSRNMKIHLRNSLAIKVMFRDYGINGLKSNRVYELIIKSGQPTVSVGQNIKLSLNNGSVLIGKMEAFDITRSITINVAGFSSTIPMSEVASIESNGMIVYQKNVSEADVIINDNNNIGESYENFNKDDVIIDDAFDKIKVTETKQYPASYNIKIGDENIHMILVQGGSLRMGYDGKGSKNMKSEPLHIVNVTSFYISEKPVNAAIALRYLNNKKVNGEYNEPAEIKNYEDVETFFSLFNKSTNKPYRLPTEAEWEYAACCNVKDQLFQYANGKKIAYEWCSDFYDKYVNNLTVITDPVGPTYGKQHVIRAYNRAPNKFNRNPVLWESKRYQGLVRLVIKADQK